MKKMFLVVGLFLLVACNRQTPPPIEESSQSSTIPPSSQTESSFEESQSSEEIMAVAANLVGTWQQENLKLIVDPNGNWQFSGDINSQGTLKVAVDSGNTKMVKLYGFNNNIDGIGNYFIANFNEDSSKMNFGYLGSFMRTAETDQKLEETTYMAIVERDGIDYNQSLLGTWIMKDTEAHYQNVWNYNPDGTFEVYSDGKGEASQGTYRIEIIESHRFNLFTTYEGESEEQVAEYTLDNGILIQKDFEEMAQIRNTDPGNP